MIVTLGAEVDVRIVFVCEVVRRGQKEIVGGRQRLTKLVGVNESCNNVRPSVVLMRVMANSASDADVGVIGQSCGNGIGGHAADHGEADRP